MTLLKVGVQTIDVSIQIAVVRIERFCSEKICQGIVVESAKTTEHRISFGDLPSQVNTSDLVWFASEGGVHPRFDECPWLVYRNRSLLHTTRMSLLLLPIESERFPTSSFRLHLARLIKQLYFISWKLETNWSVLDGSVSEGNFFKAYENRYAASLYWFFYEREREWWQSFEANGREKTHLVQRDAVIDQLGNENRHHVVLASGQSPCWWT